MSEENLDYMECLECLKDIKKDLIDVAKEESELTSVERGKVKSIIVEVNNMIIHMEERSD